MVLIIAFIRFEIHQPVKYMGPYTICCILYSSNKDGIHTRVLHIKTEEQGKKGGIDKLMPLKLSTTLKNNELLENKINSKLISNSITIYNPVILIKNIII